MKFTAIFNTEKMNGVEYSFSASNAEQAKNFCRSKFNVNDIVIINHNDRDFPIHLGDARKTSAIYRAYIKKNNNY